MCTECGCTTNKTEEKHDHHHDHDHDHYDSSDHAPESFWVRNDLVTFIATGEETDEQYAMFDVFVPIGAGSIPHIHNVEAEAFYILEGEIAFQAEDQTITATPGTLVHVPAGITHAYKNLTNKPARMLVIATPAGFENLVRETGRPGTQPTSEPFTPEFLASIVEAFERNNAVPLDSLIFASSEFSVNEDGSPVVAVTVIRPLSNQGAVSATINLSDGTANSPSDYDGMQIPVNFADGQSFQIVNIPIFNDDIIEANETIQLTLSNPTGGTTIGLLEDTAVLTIIDDDARPTGENGVPITGTDVKDVLIGGNGVEQIAGGVGNDTLTGGGSQDLFIIKLGEGIDTITDFTGVGRGVRPSSATIAEIDTLKFQGAGFTARNMLLNQDGDDLVIAFEGIEDTVVILQDFKLQNLDNLRSSTGASVDIGNILFDGEKAFQDSFDVFNAKQKRKRIFNRNTVTFLNDRNNRVKGFKDSNDVINGLGGNDKLRGLSGDDLLRGGAGDDLLVGGFGNDTLIGGSGNDVFKLASRVGIDLIVDFTDGEDLIRMSRGIIFEDLRITQGTELNATDTLIGLRETNELLAILTGVETSTIGDEDFIFV